MKKTEHYQLNQWDAEDRILREDFNGDNARIDSAIAALEARSLWQPLCSLVTGEDAEQVEVCMENFNWSDWISVHLEVEAYAETKRVVTVVEVNRTQILAATSNLPGSTPQYFGHAILFPLKDGRRNLFSLAAGGYSAPTFYYADTPFTGSSSYVFLLRVWDGSALLAGTKIQVWGVR